MLPGALMYGCRRLAILGLCGLKGLAVADVDDYVRIILLRDGPRVANVAVPERGASGECCPRMR